MRCAGLELRVWSRAGTGAALAAVSLLTGLLLVLASPAAAAGAGAGVAEQRWRWPLVDRVPVSRGFAPPASRYGSGHRGADLPGATGQPVLAAAGGVVSYAGRLAGRGVVVVTHGALRTTYEPVAAAVAVGLVVWLLR